MHEISITMRDLFSINSLHSLRPNAIAVRTRNRFVWVFVDIPWCHSLLDASFHSVNFFSSSSYYYFLLGVLFLLPSLSLPISSVGMCSHAPASDQRKSQYRHQHLIAPVSVKSMPKPFNDNQRESSSPRVAFFCDIYLKRATNVDSFGENAVKTMSNRSNWKFFQ